MSRLRRVRPRVYVIVAAAARAITAGSVAWVATAQAATAGPGFGYLWLDDAARPIGEVYTPASTYQRTSAGGANTVTRRATGSYELYFPGIARFGVPMATAYTSSSQRCKVGSWGAAALFPRTGTIVNVRCTTSTGVPTNVTFTATYSDATAASRVGQGAYLWSEQPSPTLNTPYRPTMAHQINSAGQASTVTRIAAEAYWVELTGLTAVRSVQIVATGGRAGTSCKRFDTVREATRTRVQVSCHTPTGAGVDSAFALTAAVDTGSTMFAPVRSFAAGPGDLLRGAGVTRVSSWAARSPSSTRRLSRRHRSRRNS